MMFKQWVKLAERNGWRVIDVSGKEVRLGCECIGCTNTLVVPLANPGPEPSPCNRPHEAGYAVQTFDGYRDLVKELRRRRLSLGLSQFEVNAAAGLGDGHLNKLEAFTKVASPPTLILWCESLGLRLSVTPAKLPPSTVAAIENRKNNPYAINQARFKHDT